MELFAIVVISVIFGGLFLMSRDIARMPFYQREAEGLIVKAHYYPTSAIVLGIAAIIEVVYLQVRYSGIAIWLASVVVGGFGLYFLYAGVSWLIIEHRDEAWRKTLKDEEDEKLKQVHSS